VLDDGDKFFLCSGGAQHGKAANAGSMPHAIKVGKLFRLYNSRRWRIADHSAPCRSTDPAAHAYGFAGPFLVAWTALRWRGGSRGLKDSPAGLEK
jgi:hypothetical protein